jgi:hypothetical protein
MSVAESISFGTASYLSGGSNNWGSANSWFVNLQSGLLITLASSLYNQIS